MSVTTSPNGRARRPRAGRRYGTGQAGVPSARIRPVQASIDASNPEHRSGTQTVERALAILNLFREGPDSLSITEIARQTGLHVSTAHRIVRALCAEQFMDQDARSERYQLGP